MKKSAVLVMLTVLLLHDLMGQTQLTDLSSPEGDSGSYPSDFVIFSNLLFFRASTESEGQEIWVNNGNETFLLKDIYPGNGNGAISNLTESAAELNGKLYFIAYDGEGGTQLWVTDGTENGTQPISNIAGLSGNTKLTVVGNHIFFILTIEGKLEVWKSDGTEKGTVRVRGDIASENPPAYEGAAIGLFFFSFQSEGENGFRVWRSDGTGSGTFSVTNSIGTVSSLGDGPSQFIEYKNELYFLTRSASIFSSSTPIGIMKTDGTVENTVPVSGLFNSSIVNVQITHVIEINNKLYFSFYQYDFNTLLIWESDGSAGGTKHIFTLTSEDFFSPSNLATDGEDLIFVAANSAGNASLMRLDLDTYESTQIKDLNVKPARPIFYMRDYHVTIIQVRPDLLFFTIPTDRFNTVGWVADLSTDNTFPVMDMDNAEMVSLYNDHIYFTKPSNIIQPELWRSDFSFQEIELVANINTTRFGLFSEEFAVIEDKVFFVGNDVEHGRELWAYDTTKNTVILLRDIYEGATVPFWPVGLTPVNNKLYFSALSQEYGLELWQSDGTPQGTVIVENFAEGPVSSYPYDLFMFKGQLYFTLRIDNESFLARLKNDSIEVLAGLGVNDYNIFLRLTGDVLTTKEYFYFKTLEAGPALWRSDGTIEGTIKLKDMLSLDEMVLVGDRLYFSGRDTNANQVSLWTTDGNIANTQKLDVTTALGLFNIRHLGAFEDHLIFTAETEAYGKEYWLSDGTVSGTRQLADLVPGTAGSIPDFDFNFPPQYDTLKGHLYFIAKDEDHGTELWRTNGTAAGTKLVTDINPGKIGSFPSNFISDGKRLYFTAYSPESGVELWTTQGTASDTYQLYDLIEGPRGSLPNHPFLVGDQKELYFVAEALDYGPQLWRSNFANITGTYPILRDHDFSLYPNPASDYLSIVNPNLKLSQLYIFNADGKLIQTCKAGSEQIYIGDQPAGMYLLVAQTANGLISRRFVKVN